MYHGKEIIAPEFVYLPFIAVADLFQCGQLLAHRFGFIGPGRPAGHGVGREAGVPVVNGSAEPPHNAALL